MSKTYKMGKEPYWSLIQNKLSENGVIAVNDNGVLEVDSVLARYIAKSTGLKSKKTRKIKKRFKIVILNAIDETIGEFNG